MSKKREERRREERRGERVVSELSMRGNKESESKSVFGSEVREKQRGGRKRKDGVKIDGGRMRMEMESRGDVVENKGGVRSLEIWKKRNRIR